MAHSTDERRELLATASQNLMTVRLYDRAAALLEEAARGSAKADVERIRLVRAAKKHEEIALPADDPASLMKRFMLALLGGQKGEVLTSFFSSRWREWPDFAEAMKAMESAVARRADDDLNSDVTLDLALAGLTFKTEGDAANGYRIRVEGPGGKPTTWVPTFVIKEGSDFRVLAMEGLMQWPIADQVFAAVDRGDLATARRWLDWAREGVTGASDDEPFVEHPLSRLWKERQEGTADEIRLAAAALLVDAPPKQMERARLMLEAARTTTEGDRALGVRLALAKIYSAQKNSNALLSIADELFTLRPDADAAFSMRVEALRMKGDFAAARQACDARLSKRATDPAALRALADVDAEQESFGDAIDVLRRLVATKDAFSFDYNQLAWTQLLAAKVNDQTISDAERAIGEIHSYAALHTKACVLADYGRVAEARQTILEAIGRAPQEDDWFVVGRIAEQCGETKAAAEAYRKIAKPSNGRIAQSTYAVAQRRLAGLK
jgi:tetratricopeptide (TPR) repeat protein